MIGKVKSENGSVTVEATISLSAFMFAIVTILSVVNICNAQARMSYAINATAKEISQYSYLYSLTGLNESQGALYQAGLTQTEDVRIVLSEINTVYNEIEDLGGTGNQSKDNIGEIISVWDDAAGSVENIEKAGNSIYESLSNIANDPKNLMFGIAKLAASETLDLAKSRLIAEPLAKTMVQKHLVNSEDGDVDAYLKFLGVVPSATGSYIDGLDFSQSSLFPNGSNEIRINVSYDVKVIPLLPLDFTFHFNQTAVTHGWFSGESTFKSTEDYGVESKNSTLWTDATVQERASLIRHMVIEDMQDEGYNKTCGLTDVQLYNAEKNEFVMISSMNPLWSGDGEDTKTLDDLSDVALQNYIETLCSKALSTTQNVDTITTKSTGSDGTTKKEEHDCSGASTKIVLVIPEDQGLKEKIEEIIAQSDTRGVTIEVEPSYGNGAKTTTIYNSESNTESDNKEEGTTE